MIEIVLRDLTSDEVSELVRDLKDNDLRIGVDFDFEYSTAKYDWGSGEQVPRQTKFKFYNEAYATLFALRWL